MSSIWTPVGLHCAPSGPHWASLGAYLNLFGLPWAPPAPCSSPLFPTWVPFEPHWDPFKPPLAPLGSIWALFVLPVPRSPYVSSSTAVCATACACPCACVRVHVCVCERHSAGDGCGMPTWDLLLRSRVKVHMQPLSNQKDRTTDFGRDFERTCVPISSPFGPMLDSIGLHLGPIGFPLGPT